MISHSTWRSGHNLLPVLLMSGLGYRTSWSGGLSCAACLTWWLFFNPWSAFVVKIDFFFILENAAFTCEQFLCLLGHLQRKQETPWKPLAPPSGCSQIRETYPFHSLLKTFSDLLFNHNIYRNYHLFSRPYTIISPETLDKHWNSIVYQEAVDGRNAP